MACVGITNGSLTASVEDMKKKEIEKKVQELKDILKFFSDIKKPPYKPKDCPFGDELDHYHFSEATGGLGCWCWNCPLCGLEESE